MLRGLIELSLAQRVFMLLVSLFIAGAGAYAFRTILIDAFPNIAPVQVKMIRKAPVTTPEEVEARLTAGVTKLRPQDWNSGDRLWVVEAVAPFGGAEEMVKDLKANVFPDKVLRYVATGPSGVPDMRTA